MLEEYEPPLLEREIGKPSRRRRYMSVAVDGAFKLGLLGVLVFITYYLAVLVSLTREALNSTNEMSESWSNRFSLFLLSMANGTQTLSGIELMLELLGKCVVQSGFCTS